MISRTSFLLLLFINLLLALLWLGPHFGFAAFGAGGREPERMENQLNPEQVRLSNEAEQQVSASAPSAGRAIAPVPVAASVPAAAPAQVSTSGGAQRCIQMVGLSPDQVAAVNTAARPAGEALTLREEASVSNSYWVNIPPQGAKLGADKRLAELKQQGIQEAFIVKDAGADQYAISLGLYRNEPAANRFFEILQKKGVKGARITVRENASSSRLRLSGPGEVVDGLVRELAEKLKGVEQAACSQT